jgi:hypothetical protein
MADQKVRNLLTAAKEARTVLFHLMLAEQAQRVRGTYTDIHQKLDKAIREADETPKDK